MPWHLRLKEKPYRLINSDCVEAMKLLPDNSVHAIITDGPYAIDFMGKSWDSFKTLEDYMKFSYKWAKQAIRVLRPGGYLLSFSGTRTYHWMAVGIEKAGFICRDMISWLYGSGMPKSYNVSKAMDKMAGAKRKVVGKNNNYHSEGKRSGSGLSHYGEKDGSFSNPQTAMYLTAPVTEKAKYWDGYGTNLKPCQEPIAVFQKPISEKTIAANCLRWGTGAINIDAGRIKAGEKLGRHNKVGKTTTLFHVNREDHSTDQSVLIDNSSNKGRWPGNIIHDGSTIVLDCFPDRKTTWVSPKHANNRTDNGFLGQLKHPGQQGFNDNGSAGRFFYCVKVSNNEREAGLENWNKKQSSFWQTGNGASGKPSSIEKNRKARAPRANSHPTVKPIDLMRYLISVYCPHQGIILDPFLGSGTTGIAAIKHGCNFIGIERDKGYMQIAKRRIDHHYLYRENSVC